MGGGLIESCFDFLVDGGCSSSSSCDLLGLCFLVQRLFFVGLGVSWGMDVSFISKSIGEFVCCDFSSLGP